MGLLSEILESVVNEMARTYIDVDRIKADDTPLGEYCNDKMTYHVYDNNISIKDSYLIRKKSDMRDFLETVRKLYPTNTVLICRSDRSLIREWRAHNHFYNLGIFRSRTVNVDLDYPQKWYMNVIYFLLGW